MPPQQPNIYNERRMRIDSRAGPYEEGGSLEVTCVVYGGKYCPRQYGGEAVIAVAWPGQAAANEAQSAIKVYKQS